VATEHNIVLFTWLL